MGKKEKIILTKGKRKTSIARARIKKGKGEIRINSKPLELWGSEILRMLIQEPLLLADNLSKKLDIKVNVKGGGYASQAEAIRMAIARGLVEWTGDKKLRDKFIEYDRQMLVYDPRRKEPKKPLGPGARRKKQTSKR